MLANKLLGASKAAVAANYVEDVFSTYLYTGNGTVQTIPNGIALGSRYGGSVFFDGNGDRLSIPTNTALDLTGDFTIEVWVYPTVLNSFNIILDTSQSGTAGADMTEMWVESTGVIGYYARGGYVLSGGTATLNQWNHIAVTKSGSTQRLFLNGVLVNSATSTTQPNTGYTWYIGDRQASAGSGQYPFTGYISNFRIVKGTAVYTSTFTPPTSPLTAISGTSLLTCQSPSATTDYSSNAFTITVTNAVAQNGGGPFTDSTANKGGLVWLKARSQAYNNNLFDTVRGNTKRLYSNLDAIEDTTTTSTTSFNSNGFSLGSNANVNESASTYASWTFREQPKFFDVVTYTGTGSSQNISHNLGSVPGFIVYKRTSGAANWCALARKSDGTYESLYLNTTGATLFTAANAAAAGLTSTTFDPSTIFGGESNGTTGGGQYVAYLFAHDAGGFGAAGTDNVISCGSYTGTGAAGNDVNLGFEPQWLMVKRSSSTGNWVMLDVMRGFSESTDNELYADLSLAEGAGLNLATPKSTGFQLQTSTGNLNASGSTYIYIAIRRPMKTPTSGTSVFTPDASGNNASAGGLAFDAGFPVDMVIRGGRTASNKFYAFTRLTGNGYLETPNTNAEATTTYADQFDSMTGIETTTGFNFSDQCAWLFKRAPGFFDVVCYDGSSATNFTVTHNLGVSPELVIAKSRSLATDWGVYTTALGTNTNWLRLNTADSVGANNGPLAGGAYMIVSSSQLQIASTAFAAEGNMVAYLFATVAGVSKVGSYTGTGTTQTINCGFTAGARFVLIKRTDNTGDWFVYDTARGIVSGNDPYLLLNTTAAEVTNTDYIDPANSGFEISSTAPAAINANGGTFIFLAIA